MTYRIGPGEDCDYPGMLAGEMVQMDSQVEESRYTAQKRYTDEQLIEIQKKTTAAPEDNAAVVLPLVWDLQDARREIAELERRLGDG